MRRDIGMIGLLFASVGSIIGSGWLFGALTASQIAGPAAIFSWAIAAVMIVLIGLVFAELGTMFPISGGVVRFPHLAFGSFASYTMGWITWVAAATVAPIEVEGALQYATKYANFTKAHTVDGEAVHTLTALGYVVAVVGMAFFVVVNYYGIRWFARINNVVVWWKLGVIALVIVAFMVTKFHSSNFSSHGFSTGGMHAVFTAIATAGITFSFLGFRQGVELAGETNNPKRNVPLAVVGSVILTADHLHPVAGRLHRRGEPARSLQGLGRPVRSPTTSGRSRRSRRSSGWAGWRPFSTSTRSSRRPTPG